MSVRDELLEIELSPGSLPISGVLDQWTSSTNTVPQNKCVMTFCYESYSPYIVCLAVVCLHKLVWKMTVVLYHQLIV